MDLNANKNNKKKAAPVSIKSLSDEKAKANGSKPKSNRQKQFYYNKISMIDKCMWQTLVI